MFYFPANINNKKPVRTSEARQSLASFNAGSRNVEWRNVLEVRFIVTIFRKIKISRNISMR